MTFSNIKGSTKKIIKWCNSLEMNILPQYAMD